MHKQSEKHLKHVESLLFKNGEKCFFHLKNSFCSHDIYVFVMTFWPCRKNGLIRKIKLISEFMTSQTG